MLSFSQGLEIVNAAHDDVRDLAPLSTHIVTDMGKLKQTIAEVVDGIVQLRDGGFRPERTGSTLMLAREIDRVQGEILHLQKEQQARLAALMFGLNELKG